MVRSTRYALMIALLGTLAGAAPVFAAHPLQTEDTGTQGVGNVEIENGLGWARQVDVSQFAYQPQLSVGVLPTLDLIVQPSWIRNRDASGATVRGWGDTTLDAKWRYWSAAPWSLGVRGGVTLATSQHELGLQRGTVSPHAVAVVTLDAAPIAVHGNLGIARNPSSSGQRRTITNVSGAAMWSVDQRLILTVDAGVQANPDPSRSTWVSTALAGAIYTIRPGLDVDIGYQTSVRSTPSLRQWLAGVTYRFAP